MAVIHDEFLKWGSVGPWLSKNGAHITNYGVSDFVVTTLLNLGLTGP